MIRGEIRVKTRHFPTKNIPWEFRNFQTGISTRNWSKAWQVPKSNLATSQDTTFLVIWDVVVSWFRQSEWKMRGWKMGWMRDLVGDVDGCWLSFLLEVACCTKDFVVYFVFVRPIVLCMFFAGEKCHQRKDLCFRSLGVFVGGSIEKRPSSQSTNFSWWSDQPGLSAIWKHPMNLLPL